MTVTLDFIAFNAAYGLRNYSFSINGIVLRMGANELDINCAKPNSSPAQSTGRNSNNGLSGAASKPKCL